MEERPRGRRRGRQGGGAPVYDVLADVTRRGLATPEAVVDHYAAALLAMPPPPELRQALVAYLAEGGFDLAGRDAARKLHGMLRLLVSTPEFQLS
jgi:hypothetical protein